MSFKLSQADQKIFLGLGIILLIVFAVSLLLLSSQSPQSEIPSSYSAGSGGAKAAFLLLQETGYKVQRWEQPFSKLNGGKGKVLIIAEPERIVPKDEAAALRSFMNEGGRIIAIGVEAGAMLPEHFSVLNPMRGNEWEEFPALAPSGITRAAPQITMAPKASWLSKNEIALYGRDSQKMVVTYPYGKGTVIWWASATPLTNAGLKVAGNMEFFLACLEKEEEGVVYWDEYSHGYGGSRSIGREKELLTGMLAQLLIIAIAVLLTHSRRSGPVRSEAVETRLSPTEFVETLGGVYERAGASSVAVDICFQRLKYNLVKRLGITANASIEEIAQTVFSRWNYKNEKFIRVMTECASARYEGHVRPSRALELVKELHSLEIELLHPHELSKEKKQWKL